jgi:hypothetical protein
MNEPPNLALRIPLGSIRGIVRRLVWVRTRSAYRKFGAPDILDVRMFQQSALGARQIRKLRGRQRDQPTGKPRAAYLFRTFWKKSVGCV